MIELHHQWENYTKFATLLNRLFLYMEQNFIVGGHRKKLGHQTQVDFKKKIMEGLEGQVQNTLIAQINSDRDDEQIDRNAVKGAIQIYIDLGREGQPKPVRKDNRFYWEGNDNLEYYETQFEAVYLESTR